MEAQESLAIIEQMISNSKSHLKHSSKYFLLWGWGVFIAASGQFILLQMLSSKSYYVWLLVLPLCTIISIVMSIRDRKQQTVRTYTSTAMNGLWTSMGISFLIITFMAFKIPMNPLPVFLILYGIGTFTSGKLIDFKPLVYGGLFSFIMSIVCLYTEGSYDYLVLSIAILGSYIIPGHLLLKADNHE